MDKHLHIVTFDIPWPADYGGVIDLFYKIKSLYALGIKIHLHCFKNKRTEQPELNRYCESVQYYNRKKGSAAISFTIPYIVQSRSDGTLLKNLLEDDHPILLEGIHCTYFLKHNTMAGRKVFVRLHNVEYKYYQNLARHENNIFRKIYFTLESRLLKNYERRLAKKGSFLALSMDDVNLYKKEFNAEKISFLPAFVPWDKVNDVGGSGCFCLYHGNLTVNENEKAADWLLNEVFSELKIAFVIAGKAPSLPLQTLAQSNTQTCMVIDPEEAEMQDLINKAQINILPSFNHTGVKIKLLNALFNGRHCLVNKPAIEGSGLEGLCHVATTAEEFKKQIKKLFNTPLTEKDTQQRNEVLNDIYNNEKNARQLIAWIY